MLYVDLATEETKTKSQLLSENKHISFPLHWTAETLRALNVVEVQKTTPPTPGDEEELIRDGVENVDGVWQEKWTLKPMFADSNIYDENGNVVGVVTADQQRADKAAFDLKEAEAAERATRDDLLKATDHYGLSDVTMTDAMVAYRQALRDVPQQAGFPSTITWPEKPE